MATSQQQLNFKPAREFSASSSKTGEKTEEKPNSDMEKKYELALEGSCPVCNCKIKVTGVVSTAHAQNVLTACGHIENEENLKHKTDSNINKCSICLEEFVTPVASLYCGHVFCEKCWKQVITYRRVCPKCKERASPKSLHKIFL